MAKIFVASSWRNALYEKVVHGLASRGHTVWNWREPPTGTPLKSWKEIIPDHAAGGVYSARAMGNHLSRPAAVAAFAGNLTGMNWCDVGVLLYPCGKSAHLEAGWMAGRGKTVHTLSMEPMEPELMLLALNGDIYGLLTDLLDRLYADYGLVR